MSKPKRHRGHFCWSCGRIRPNEDFSGRGHRVHVCRDCSELGEAELAVRQVLRNLERAAGPTGFVRRNQRPFVESFRHHTDERVRRFVSELLDRHVGSDAFIEPDWAPDPPDVPAATEELFDETDDELPF